MAYPSTSSAPTDLLSQLSEKFELARKSGELFYFPSTAKDVYTKDGRRVSCLSSTLLISDLSPLLPPSPATLPLLLSSPSPPAPSLS